MFYFPDAVTMLPMHRRRRNKSVVGNIIFCFVDSPKSETLLCIRDARPKLEMID